MIISIPTIISLRPRRAFNRRRLLASLLLFALFPLGLSAQDAIRIITKTELHSANWIWSEEPKIPEYPEFDDAPILGKARFPRDLERKKIGIGEIINLKLKEKPGSNAAGDKSKATWTIIEGGQWAGFSTKNGASGSSIGEAIMIGARVENGPSPRTMKVRVTTDTTPALTAEVTITIVNPATSVVGALKSRHAGPPPLGADVPPTDQFAPNTMPAAPPATGDISFSPNKISAVSRLILIPEPTDVSFGGPFNGGVHIIEKDLKSPPKPGTFTPPTDSLYATSTHSPTNIYVKMDETTAGFEDVIGSSDPKPPEGLSQEHTCIWTCEWRWSDKDNADKYNKRETLEMGGIAFEQILQKFKAKSVTGTGATQVQNLTISKFNSSVTRNTGAADSTRDIDKNGKP
jgi:hypothetical protein